MSDAFAGRISFLKVYSGVVKTDVTVQNYTSSIYSKLDVNTRARAILYAMQHGLVEPAREA